MARRSLRRPPARLQGEAAAIWREVAQDLLDAGVLTETTAPVLEAWCAAVARWRRTHALLERTGLLVGQAGDARPNPLLRVLADAEAAMVRLGTQLAMKAERRERGGDDDWQEALRALIADTKGDTEVGDSA